MPSDIRNPEATPLAGAELDLVAGGASAWYEVFYAVGFFIGSSERAYQDSLLAAGGVIYTM